MDKGEFTRVKKLVILNESIIYAVWLKSREYGLDQSATLRKILSEALGLPESKSNSEIRKYLDDEPFREFSESMRDVAMTWSDDE